jgi:hypothetical protein
LAPEAHGFLSNDTQEVAGAVWTAGSLQRDFRFAVRTILGGWVFRPLCTIHKRIHGLNDQEEHHRRQNQETDDCVKETTNSEVGTIDGEPDCAEIWLAAKRGNQRHDDVFGNGRDDVYERSTDDNGNCERDHIATQDEFLKLLTKASHGISPFLKPACYVT